MAEYRLPDGRVPVLLSSDSVDGLRAEAAAVRGYLLEHPEVSAERLADMLFRTRLPRRRRALILAAAGAAGNDELSAALDAIATDADHPSVVRGDVAASARRVGFVFPGQGSQRPGMGALFYAQSAAYRAVVDECAALHEERFGHSQPLHYLLGHEGQYEDTVWEVQPALMFHMTGLAAVWRAAGVEPSATVGHSQGELAAGAVSGVMTLRDSVLAVTHRALLADRLSPRGYSMAVFGMDRESVEALMARHSGWAELAVVNSPHIIAISGERGAVIDLVEAATARGQFAREIRVAFPAHTSIVAEVRSDFEGFLGDEMSATNFAPTEIPCYGATLGEPITPDLKQEEYWFWNLRNRVRFDRAVVNAGSDGVDLMIEVAEHPILQLALQENLSQVPARPGLPPRDFRVLGTSLRTAEDLSEFTRNLAQVAVLDLGYRWDALRVDDSVTLPLRDFPHTITAPKRLWAPLGTHETPAELVVSAPKPQRLVEEWTPLQRRTLTAPRSLLIVDHTGECAETAAALVAAADRHGADAWLLGQAELGAAEPADTVLVLLPADGDDSVAEATDALIRFYADRPWAAALSALRPGGECWLLTVGGEAVHDSDPLPGLFQAGVAAGFRSVGIEHPGIRFRHLDLAAHEPAAAQAAKIIGAVHSTGEAELALRSGKLFVKRLVCDAVAESGSLGTDLDHVVIVGGTGKLGLRFTEHLAQAGAGRVTLLSRSGETEVLAGELARLRRLGNTEIVVRACDVSDAVAAKAFAAEIADRPADLVIHAAVNYVDAELGEITAGDVRTAAAAKLRGLDHLVDHAPLTADARVLLCSSMAATLGGRGQILYAVTNRMLDVAARRLRARGIAAASLQWGLWSVAGPLDDAGFARVEEAGVYPMVPADAIAAGLAEPVRDGMIIAADWDFLREVLGAFGQESLLTGLESAVPVRQANTSRPAAAPRSADAVERAVSTAAANDPVAPPSTDTVPLDLRMRTELLKVIGGDSAESIDATMPLVALGLDSLQALDFRKRVKAELDRDLPVAAILGGASLDDVVLLMAQNTNQG
ncbi:nocobactin polyketide synthase NbtC [Nocardia neocaledoniensis]|uniref:nocobactin polyketide synthase NbtC n=1 Tax=Nocardia neocaledoniensis TaxID=236511 RepID=UPI0024590CF2|nr:nocobactin polyketide synthase NbtC [Nocardia neocaledoniensis]